MTGRLSAQCIWVTRFCLLCNRECETKAEKKRPKPQEYNLLLYWFSGQFTTCSRDANCLYFSLTRKNLVYHLEITNVFAIEVMAQRRKKIAIK
jgi:hypothetical protein